MALVWHIWVKKNTFLARVKLLGKAQTVVIGPGVMLSFTCKTSQDRQEIETQNLTNWQTS